MSTTRNRLSARVAIVGWFRDATTPPHPLQHASRANRVNPESFNDLEVGSAPSGRKQPYRAPESQNNQNPRGNIMADMHRGPFDASNYGISSALLCWPIAELAPLQRSPSLSHRVCPGLSLAFLHYQAIGFADKAPLASSKATSGHSMRLSS
jgi:hypothetical protein